MERSQSVVFAAVMLLCAALAACDGDSSSGAGGNGQSEEALLPCDVAAVLAKRCQTCHGESPSFGAPMSLVSQSDVVSPSYSDPSRSVAELISQRIHAEKGVMPPPPNEPLSQPERATLDAWIELGAPAVDFASCPGIASGTAETGATCTPDTSVAPTSAWTMEAGEDIYVCYRFDPPPGRSATAFIPRVDNASSVHHMILYIGSDDTIGTDPQGPCGAEMSAVWRMVYGWAPGGQALTLPADVGLELEPGEHFIVQTHYSNPAGLAGATDTSGIDLCTTDEPPLYQADVMAFGTIDFTIPPHASYGISCDFTIPSFLGTFNAIAALPHMHALGTSIENQVLKGGSESAAIDIGSVPNWDFSLQAWKTFDATLAPGDVVRTKCTWNNTTGSPVDQGEYTQNEMCLDFVLYYPKTDALLSWGLPAGASTCVETER